MMARQDRKRQTRQLILDTAEVLFRHNSYGGMRMAQVTDRLGLSRKTLYNYFPGGKRELWKACIERRMEELASRLFVLVRDTRRDFVERSRDILDIGREAMAILYGPGGLISSNEDESLFFPNLRERYTEALVTFFREGILLGYLREGLPVHSLATSLIVLIAEWGRPASRLNEGEVKDLPEFVEKVLFDGILSREGRRSAPRLHEGGSK